MSTEWKMVPVEPTDDMIEAGFYRINWTCPGMGDAFDVYAAMLSAAPDAPGEPVARVNMRLTIERKIGSYGCAFDGPKDARAYTYKHQPSNQPAWLMGRAIAKVKSLGVDYIDGGLYLLQALEQEGFGVFELVDGETAEPDTTPTPGLSAIRAEESDAIRDVRAERRRQVEVEGWTPEHDDQHDRGEMAKAAACYAIGDTKVRGTIRVPGPGGLIATANNLWPWSRSLWKPKDRRRDLVRGAALFIAEIERIDRAASRALATEGK